jgi:hypothetical protein
LNADNGREERMRSFDSDASYLYYKAFPYSLECLATCFGTLSP